jgi:esterase/lipase superfamily enzyme
MYRPVLALVAALALGAAAVRAQQVPSLEVPAPCRVGTNEALPELEKRKQRLEREVAQVREKASAIKDVPKGDARVSALEKTLRTNQEDLLKVVFQIACTRAKAQLAAEPVVVARSPTAKKSEVIEIATYYATNRSQTASTEPLKLYGTGFDRSLHYGKAVVTIPLTHVTGRLELPKIWKLQREPDPSKHFTVRSVVPMGKDAVRREMQETLTAGGNKAILLFVHGYYLGFPEAAMRTAQLAHDLKFAGVPFFYSWPSAAQLFSYWQDEEAAELSEPLFETLLDDLSFMQATDIYIIAHSMGNRIVSQALKARVDQGKPTRHVREVLLAAPDINAELFRTVIAPKLAAMQGTRTTIYASSSDLALMASKIVHGFRRLGETADGVFTFHGLDTVDASTATQANRAYGHFYLMDNSLVLKDVRTIIEEKRAAKDRGLNIIGKDPNIFYRLN